MTSTIGIPIKLLNEATVRTEQPDLYFSATLPKNHKLTISRMQGHVVTIEITSGQVYRGRLLEGAPAHLSLTYALFFLSHNIH